ncbi:MAG TPA: ABC transporter substrate-binding protein [Candidatus Krumholzibacterium sp.]|nr:ABC transporter substrate-binding protein [Candidatus Krumholzibacterium sp.]
MLALVLTACALVQSCSGPVDEPVIRLALQTEPDTGDPAFAVDYASGQLVSLTHQNLVRIGSEGEIEPSLAASWTVSPDGMEYVFRLRRSGFPDGTPVTASDVVFSFNRLISRETMSPRWWVLEHIRGARGYHVGGDADGPAITAPDSMTVVIGLEKPVAHLLSLLTMPAAAIVSRKAVLAGGDYGSAPAGSGPWVLSAWSDGESLTFIGNSHSSDFNADVEGVSIRIIPEPMTRIAEFEIGNLDLLEVPRAELDRWKAAGAKLMDREELSVVYIGLNNAKGPLGDPDVRRALNMAVDTETIIARVLFGAGRKAFGSVPPALKGGDRGRDLYPYDPERARALLEKAGYPDGFRMEIWQRENPEAGRILESVQAYLAKVGIVVDIVTRDWTAFKQAVDKGTPDAFYLDWFADYPDRENFLMPLFHTSNRGGGGNRSAYSNATVDSLLEAASAEQDAGVRASIYGRVEETVYDEAPWIFLWFPVRYEVASYRLRGYEIPVIYSGQDFSGVRVR